MVAEHAEQEIRELNEQVERLAEQVKYEEALELARRVYERAQSELGVEHLETSNSLSLLGVLLLHKGEFTAARPHLEQALEITRRVLGDDHPDTATCINNLGGLLKNNWDLAGAKLYYEQALAVRRRVFGNDHLDTANSLNNLGCLLRDMGDLAAARQCHEQALEVRRRLLGNEHLTTATSLNNVGDLMRDMGDLRAARLYYEQALEIHRRLLGLKHFRTATSLNNLGVVLRDLGEAAAARASMEQALEIQRGILGDDHPYVAISLNNIGALLRAAGDLAGARSHYEQALEIKSRALEVDHPDTAASLNNLGRLLAAGGDLIGARSYYQRALEIQRRVLGNSHFHIATTLHNLGTVVVALARIAEGLEFMCQATVIDDRTISQIFSIGSERQRMLFLGKRRANQDAFLSLLCRLLSDSSEIVGMAFDLVLRRKALGSEALAAQRDAVLSGRCPQLREALERLTELRRRIAQKALAGPASGETLAGHEQTLYQLREEQQQRETELARQIPEMNLEQQLQNADRRAVALALSEGVALIEFVRFGIFDFHAVPARGERRWQPPHYLAFVLPSGQPDQVQMIDLGEADPIDRMIADFRDSVAVDPQDRQDRDMRRRQACSTPEPQEQVGRALRAAVFDKLVPALAGCKHLLLAPDGDLTRLPFEVLPDAEGRQLLEQYAISYLSCGRDVLRFAAVSSGQPTDPLVVADPLFDLVAQPEASAPATATHSRCSRDFKRCDYHFARLPGTREEGERVAELLGVRPWLEGAALEGRLKERRSPRVLHLATHGFFLTDQERDPNKETGAVEMVEYETGSFGRLSGPLPENPLLRSGLALAGAQSWLDGRPLPPEAEDGLLTAEDVTGLDLLDTELVVLSACETGLGEVQPGEGVFGLRRAFVVAGARTLVMSLWKVPDEQTRELMVDFYGRVLSGRGVADALRQAQLALRQKHPDPYFWGAFICLGNPGPLALSGRS